MLLHVIGISVLICIFGNINTYGYFGQLYFRSDGPMEIRAITDLDIGAIMMWKYGMLSNLVYLSA